MILFPLGLLIAFTSLAISVMHLRQSADSYYDFVALAMVLGGTFAVAVITIPWEYWSDIKSGLSLMMAPHRRNQKDIIQTGIQFVENPLTPEVSGVHGLAKEIFIDGAELISLGFNEDKIESILKERVYQGGYRARRLANAVKSLAKYPPAFGLMGTILGLVNLMRSLSAGLTAQQTGLEMAVALVATFYGLILANLILNPAGEMILRKATEEEEAGELALQAVLLSAERISVLEAQEMLNSFVAKKDRVNVLDQIFSKEAA
jgi:chemotaxis protein MotA